MATSTGSNFFRDLRVGSKLTLIPAFFILALVAILYFTTSTLKHQQGYISVLEYVGRQRMLQQLYVNFSLRIIQAPTESKKQELREQREYTRSVWEDSQAAIINGGTLVEVYGFQGNDTIPPAPNESLKDLLRKQDLTIKEIIKQADQLLLTTPSDPEYQTLLDALDAQELAMRELGSQTAKGFTSYMESSSASLIQKQMIVALVVGLLGITFSLVVANGISTPLQHVVNSAGNVAKGNLRIEKLALGSRDEIGLLSDAFDDMLDNLKELSSQILGVTGNVNSAAAEILASTQQQASSTKEQAATVQEISATMQEISQSGAEIAEKAKQVATSAEATSAASQSGLAAVQNTSRIMEGIRQQVEEVAQKIVSLSERTQAIGQIINTVNEIAEQSNLLALNASIEAASAGEQGSRFAVVAGEMRNLAQRAKESTVQVGNILGEIQRGINGSVMLAEEAVKRSDSGKQQAEVSEQTIHQMMQTTVESVHAFQQIIGATSQQQIGFDQVTQGMRDIRQASEQTAIGTAQLEKALSNLNELSMQLRTAVSRYQL